MYSIYGNLVRGSKVIQVGLKVIEDDFPSFKKGHDNHSMDTQCKS